MELDPAEQATIRAFVASEKRDRLLGLLASRKRRRQATDLLNHFTHWDPRYSHLIPSSADVLVALRQSGAPEQCHVISADPSLDGRDMPLPDAVMAAEEYTFASLLCCLPGQLALFFDEVEAPRNRILLRRMGK
jgi:hypothetical protein